MTTGKIIHASHDGMTATLAVRVEGDTVAPHPKTGELRPVAVEYLVQAPLRDASGALKSNASLRAELLALVKEKRDSQKKGPPPPATIPGAEENSEIDL